MIHGSISHVKSAAAAKREKEVPQNWSKIFLKLQELTNLNRRDGNSSENFHSSGIRGSKEWQFFIPRGPRGISGNEIFLNLPQFACLLKEKSRFLFIFTILKNTL